MIKAQSRHKGRILDILTVAFDDNKSVNFVVRQGPGRIKRIRQLMEYSYEMCLLQGEVYVSDDLNACVLLILPEKKRASFKSTFLDLKLAFTAIGVKNIKKVAERTNRVHREQPLIPFLYLWFLGVDPKYHKKGIGGTFLKEITEYSEQLNLPLCLETSTVKNVPWYEKFGFQVYKKIDCGYDMFMMQKG